MAKTDLSIIIVNYNSKDYLNKCVHSIKRSDTKRINYEIIVVDNASSDGSQEEILDLSRRYKIKPVLSKTNLGFSKGNNLGVKKSSGRYVLFLNPDTMLEEKALKRAFNFMEENPQVGVVGGYLYLESKELDNAAHRGFPTPWNAISQFTGLRAMFPHSKIFAGYTMGWILENPEPHEIDATTGAFFFVRREVGESLGWWDEEYFMYGEDLDFCYRAKNAGWKIMFLPEVRVLHYGGVSAGIRKHITKKSTASRQTRIRSASASTEAMRIFYRKHYKDKYPAWLTKAVLLGVKCLEEMRRRRIN